MEVEADGIKIVADQHRAIRPAQGDPEDMKVFFQTALAAALRPLTERLDALEEDVSLSQPLEKMEGEAQGSRRSGLRRKLGE